MKQFKKINANELNADRMESLTLAGWEEAGPLANNPSVIRFVRNVEVGGDGEASDVVLDPENVTIKLRGKTIFNT